MKSLKLIVLVLLLVFIIPGLGGFSELAAKKKNVIKVLSIGNSFSEDAVENYLYELAEASGKEIVIGNLLIGGCTLEKHLDNALHNASVYEYRKIDRKGRYIRDKNKSMKSVLKEEFDEELDDVKKIKRKNYQPKRNPSEDFEDEKKNEKSEKVDMDATREIKLKGDGVKSKAKELLGDIFPFKED